MSEAVVKILADQPWWAAAASDTSKTEGHMPTSLTKTIGMTLTAQMPKAVLRAALTVQPALIKREEIQPPPMLPTSAIR